MASARATVGRRRVCAARRDGVCVYAGRTTESTRRARRASERADERASERTAAAARRQRSSSPPRGPARAVIRELFARRTARFDRRGSACVRSSVRHESQPADYAYYYSSSCESFVDPFYVLLARKYVKRSYTLPALWRRMLGKTRQCLKKYGLILQCTKKKKV